MEITGLTYFESTGELRDWLEKHHGSEKELWVGFYKVGSGKRSISYGETLDEMLCFGWIDGIRKRVDDESFTNRFTPRKPRSIWSQVNIKRIGELTAERRMHEAGLKAFNERKMENTNQYSFEQKEHVLPEELEAEFQAHADAYAFFMRQPPGYKKTAIWWVISPKREETKAKRLQTLIEDSRNGKRLAAVTYERKEEQ